MKDIEPNQEGLMSLANKRPDVVEKMGYDPDSFAAGGLAMLEAGGMAMDPDMAIEVFKEKQGIESFFGGGMSNKKKKTNTSLAFSKTKKDEEEEDEEKTMMQKIKEGFLNFEVPESADDFQDMTMPQGLTSGGIGPLNTPKIPPITRMFGGGMANTTADPEFMESFVPTGKKFMGIDIGLLMAGNIDNQARQQARQNNATNNSQGIASLDDDLKGLIDNFPGLSGADRDLQKAILDLQRAQQYTPDSAQYIDESSPLKAIYRPYYSEVTKAYNVGKPGRFDPMAAAPEERVRFNLTPRRIEGQAYAADGGMMVDGQIFPDRDDLVTGPGGERDDKIPAMLSDGEFITNAKAVRGIGALAGAPADDPFAQRMEGAKQMYALQKAAEGYMGSMS